MYTKVKRLMCKEGSIEYKENSKMYKESSIKYKAGGGAGGM